MEIQEMIEKLKEFDPRHIVELEIISLDGLDSIMAPFEEAVFEGGNCVLRGKEYL